MKKIKLNIVLTLVCFLCVFSTAFAKNIENLYVVKDACIDNYTIELSKVLESSVINKNIIYSAEKKYFIGLYPSNNDINLYLNCDKDILDLFQQNIKSLDYKIYSIADRDLQNKYSADLKKFIQLNDIQTDKIKLDKNTYNPYNKPIKNKTISTTYYAQDGISFVTNKVAMESKIKRYVNGFEIIIKNNNNSNVVLKNVSTGDFVGLTEIAKKAVIPSGVDFIPIYSIIAGAKTDLEKNRFTRPFPINYVLKQGHEVRILGIAKLQVEPIIDFIFEMNDTEKEIQLNTYK